MGIKLKGGLPKDNGMVHLTSDLDEDTSHEIFVVLRCRAEDSTRHNDTGEFTHHLKIQGVEAAVDGAEFADRLRRMHDDMRERRTGSRQMEIGEGDEGIPGGSTGDESEAERQARLQQQENEAARREAEADAAAAAEGAGEPLTADPDHDEGEDTTVPPATFSGGHDAGDDTSPADPPADLTTRRSTKASRGGASRRGQRARA